MEGVKGVWPAGTRSPSLCSPISSSSSISPHRMCLGPLPPPPPPPPPPPHLPLPLSTRNTAFTFASVHFFPRYPATLHGAWLSGLEAAAAALSPRAAASPRGLKLVVIGGGLAEAKFRDNFLDWVQDGFKERAWPIYRNSPIDPEKVTTRFEWAEGGDAAASIGMAYTARELFS